MTRLQQRLIKMGERITSYALISDLWISKITYPGISITATGATRKESEAKAKQLWDEMVPRDWIEGLCKPLLGKEQG